MLAACASTSGSAPTFDLVAPATQPVSRPAKAWQLVVDEPTAVYALESDRIVVKIGADRIETLGGATWSDRLPRLLQLRMIEALQASGAIRAVADKNERVDRDYELSTQISEFQINVIGGQAEAHVALFARIIDNRAGRILASKAFSAQVPTNVNDRSASVRALNEALGSVLNDLVAWVTAVS